MKSALSGRNFYLSLNFSIFFFQNPTISSISFTGSKFILCLRLTNASVWMWNPTPFHSAPLQSVGTTSDRDSGVLTTQGPSTLLWSRPALGPGKASEWQVYENGGGQLFSSRPTRKNASWNKNGQEYPTGPSREDRVREGEEVHLPRRPCPKGETAARAGPASGHGGGAQRSGPEGEPGRHDCPGSGTESKRERVWDASLASKPRWAGKHHSRPAETWREPQTSAAAKRRPKWAEPPRRSTFQRSPCARSPPWARPPRRGPWDGGGVGVSRKALWDWSVLELCLLSGDIFSELKQNPTVYLL